MSVLERLKRWRLAHQLNESDAPADTSTAMTRSEGGAPDGDTPATTGTGTSSEFVGRVAADETDTGAEARAGLDDDPGRT
jgi:hypothetical protein